jgi:hypothetical protein
MPTMGDVETALAALGGDGGSGSADGLELELASLDDALAATETFELERVSSPPAIGMEDLLALAERYPGLKITLSF